MGSSPLMALGVKALTANYAALQVTSHNIANANVDGYSRQRVELTTSPGQFTGAGFFGKGVDVATVTRTHDAFLTREVAGTRSLAALEAARLTQLERLEALFRPGETGLGHVAGTFFNSMVDLSSHPADAATRQVVMARAAELAARFREAGEGLDTLQQGINSDLRVAVARVNSLAAGIAEANRRIADSRGLGQTPNDLLDERERLIAQLAEQIQISRVEAGDGSVAVFIGGGQRLVLGSQAESLAMMSDPADPSRMAVGMDDGARKRPLDASLLGGGTIAGLLRFQNDDLAHGRALVGQLAAAIGHAVNEQQQLGLTLQPPLGSVSGSPMFAIGAPRVVAHAGNASPLHGVSLTVTDAAALRASEYDLAADPANPGRWLLTRLADGVQTSVASGDVVDGLRIDIGAPAPAPGDRFRLQPVSRAANGFGLLLDDPRDLAAAAPLVAQADAGNRGTASVAALDITTAPLPVPGARASVVFTDDLGNYDWELRDAGGALLGSGSGSWQPGRTIPAPPAAINGFALTLAGVPRSGDRLSVEPTPASAVASNNGNVAGLLALRDAGIVGGLSVTESYAQAMASVGVRVQGLRSASEIASAVAAQAEQALSSKTGVNLDEEAARLIQYQQSYQAAAKVLQVAQSLFDSLLQAAAV